MNSEITMSVILRSGIDNVCDLFVQRRRNQQAVVNRFLTMCEARRAGQSRAPSVCSIAAIYVSDMRSANRPPDVMAGSKHDERVSDARRFPFSRQRTSSPRSRNYCRSSAAVSNLDHQYECGTLGVADRQALNPAIAAAGIVGRFALGIQRPGVGNLFAARFAPREPLPRATLDSARSITSGSAFASAAHGKRNRDSCPS